MNGIVLSVRTTDQVSSEQVTNRRSAQRKPSRARVCSRIQQRINVIGEKEWPVSEELRSVVLFHQTTLVLYLVFQLVRVGSSVYKPVRLVFIDPMLLELLVV